VVAEACASALAPYDIESRTRDAIELLGSAGSRIGEWVFRSILSVPPLYDALHFSQLRDGKVIAQKLLSCAYRTGQRFGAMHLIDVLVGRMTERVKQFGCGSTKETTSIW